MSLEEIIKVSERGNLTVPKGFREELGIEGGGIVMMKKENGKIVIVPVEIKEK